MGATNNSYLTDTAELNHFSDGRYSSILTTTLDSDDGDAALSGDRQTRVFRAMNTGARILENLWRKHYNLTGAGRIVDTVDADNPDERVKEWNARLTINVLETMRPTGGITEARQAIINEISTALAPGSAEVLSTSRSDQVLPESSGALRDGTVFDDANQFGPRVVPSSETDGFVE